MGRRLEYTVLRRRPAREVDAEGLPQPRRHHPRLVVEANTLRRRRQPDQAGRRQRQDGHRVHLRPRSGRSRPSPRPGGLNRTHHVHLRHRPATSPAASGTGGAVQRALAPCGHAPRPSTTPTTTPGNAVTETVDRRHRQPGHHATATTSAGCVTSTTDPRGNADRCRPGAVHLHVPLRRARPADRERRRRRWRPRAAAARRSTVDADARRSATTPSASGRGRDGRAGRRRAHGVRPARPAGHQSPRRRTRRRAGPTPLTPTISTGLRRRWATSPGGHRPAAATSPLQLRPARPAHRDRTSPAATDDERAVWQLQLHPHRRAALGHRPDRRAHRVDLRRPRPPGHRDPARAQARRPPPITTRYALRRRRQPHRVDQPDRRRRPSAFDALGAAHPADRPVRGGHAATATTSPAGRSGPPTASAAPHAADYDAFGAGVSESDLDAGRDVAAHASVTATTRPAT